MRWNTQPRTLDVMCDAFPKYYQQDLFVGARVCGSEKLGRLADYEVDVSTIEAHGLYVNEMHKYVDLNSLVGARLTVKIAIEGNGTWQNGVENERGGINLGADIREIAGIIASAKCLGADERRVFYRFRLRPWLWLATLNRESKTWLNVTVEDITQEILKKYAFPVKWMLGGPGYGRTTYPRRDYQRQYWESDYEFLSRLWEEWGIIQINGSGITNGSPGPILEKGATWSKASASTLYPRLNAFATHPFQYSCDEAAGTAVSSAVVPPPAAVQASDPAAPKGNSGSKARASNSANTASDANSSAAETSNVPTTGPTTPIGSADAGIAGPACKWKGIDFKTDPQEQNIDSGKYCRVNYDGSFALDKTNQKILDDWSQFAGKFEIAYDSQKKLITLTARILLNPVELFETGSDGVERSVSYEHDLDWDSSITPSRVRRSRQTDSIASFVAAAKSKIENAFNRYNYYLIDMSCPNGQSCGAKIPVKFVVDFVTDESKGSIHKNVNLFPAASRADAANWGEKNVTSVNKKGEEKYYDFNREQIHTHEVGHLFGFPDEYYWAGGAIHKTYIEVETETLKYSLAKNNPNKNIWQGETTNTLMGGGCLLPKAELPPYYLEHVVSWFSGKTGCKWEART